MAKAKKGTAIPSSEDNEWRARDDMSTLSRAEEIRSDSKRYAAAIACGRKEMKRLQKTIEKK